MGAIVARIQFLAENVFRKIAAGEVIERPLSVVKELVENAIDAGADTITVALSAGGKELIRVEDNGSGFAADDIEIAFQRHTTSKLTELEDLDRLHTLGFRGEALPSILEVADIDLVRRPTTTRGEAGIAFSATAVLQEKKQARPPPGQRHHRQPAVRRFPGAPQIHEERPGRIAAGQRFFGNNRPGPPRHRLYAAHNGRSRFFLSRGREPCRAHLPGFRQGVSGRFAAVDFSCRALPAQRLYFGGPDRASAARTGSFSWSTAGRCREKTLQAAFNNTFQSYLEKSRSPAGVLNLAIPPDQIDVNIHPMKLEIRFLDSQRVYQFIKNAITCHPGRQRCASAGGYAEAFPAVAAVG